MRIIHLSIVLCTLLLAVPAWAVDDFYGPQGDSSSNDGRRPDLGIGSGRNGDVGVSFGGDGGSDWEEFYVEDLDLAPFMDRLYEVLTNEEWLGKYPEVANFAEYFKSIGMFDLSSVHSEYAITGDSMYFMMHEEYDGIDPESYLGKILALPDAMPISSEYITNDFLLYCVANNYDDYAFIAMEEMLNNGELAKIMELLGEDGFGGGEMAQAWGMVEALDLDNLLDRVVTGEIAFVFYDMPPLPMLFEGDVMPTDFDAAIMIGINDLEYVQGMIDNYGGDIGLLEREYESDDWTYYIIQGADGVGLMLNDELVIITPNLDTARQHVMAAEGLGLEPCAGYFSLNFEELHNKLIEPLMQIADAELANMDVELPTEPLAYLLELPDSSELGKLTAMTSMHGDSYNSEVRMKKAVVQYMVYYVGLGLCGAAQAGAFGDAF